MADPQSESRKAMQLCCCADVSASYRWTTDCCRVALNGLLLGERKPSCIRRLRVRSAQSGAVRICSRSTRTRRRLHRDAVAGADVVQQEVAVRMDDLVAERHRGP